MDDDLFTYEIGIPGLSYPLYGEPQCENMKNSDLVIYERIMCYDECEKIYSEAVIFVNGKLKRGDDEEVLDDKEVSDVENENLATENEIAEIFRIETDIFDFETPLCKAYDEHKNGRIYEWNNDVPWVANMPWVDYGPWMEPKDDTKHSLIQNGDVIYFVSYEWYENLKEGELKDEALNNKAVFEGPNEVGTNNDNETRKKQGWFNEHGLMGDDDDDISDLEDNLI
ncbi:hypothetical protein Tco_0966946 [Tanacetum coccineum]